MSERRTSIAGSWGQIVLGVAAILALYLGAYLILLESKLYFHAGVDRATGQNLFEIEPRYRAGGNSLKRFLAAAHRLDRWLRPEFWTTIEHSSGRKWKNPPPTAPPTKLTIPSGD